jgi:tetratricopeptide (TPR) repeat protein
MDSPRLNPRFNRWDYLAFGVVLFLSLSVYVYTLAPSVTLEDSGEFITAAVHFGVPHPPGYPLWTIGTWLISNFFQIGNVAWRVNLFSALCGSLASALLALLVSHSSRWIGARITAQESFLQRSSFWCGITAGMIIAFSDVMWSQAVIAEVYTLNALCLMGTIVLFYRWIRTPEEKKWLNASVFVFSLGLTNHHTLLFLAPVFLVGVWMVESSFFADFFISVISLALSSMTLLVWFSGNQDLETITQRLALILMTTSALMTFWKTKRFSGLIFLKASLGSMMGLLLFSFWMKDWFKIESFTGAFFLFLTSFAIGLLATSTLRWKSILKIVALGWVALSLYGYMRFASSTNPPMNWGFASEKGGFYHAVSRGQYGDSLTNLIKGTIGPLVKYTPPHSAPSEASAEDQFQYFKKIWQGIWMYYHSLEDNFSLPLVIAVFPALIYANRFARRHRAWFWSLTLSYLFLAVLMTFISPPSSIDTLSQWMMKVFHLQSHCILVIGIGYGLVAGMVYLQEKNDFDLSPWIPAVALLCLIPLQDNIATSNQRDRWFGWHFGVDSLRDLEPGAIVFGGTDPGRFIPTYTIFCESTQNPRWKRDPSFDRSDLYIITQNALADRYYLEYIRHQYDDAYRPHDYSSFEKWLGRDKQYPKASLTMPSDEEFNDSFSEVAQKKMNPDANGKVELSGFEEVFQINGIIAKAIFEKNKNDHAFYLEESFPILWMYEYATPHGLLIKLNPEPVGVYSPEIIRKDREFWDRYTAFLITQPGYFQDPPATRSFSKLRCSIGNLYLYRKMFDEAEYAYRQALQLAPDHAEVVMRLSEVLLQKHRITEAKELLESALQKDPYQTQFNNILKIIREQGKLEEEEKQMRTLLLSNKQDPEIYLNLFHNLVAQKKVNEIDPVALDLLKFPNLPTETVQEVFGLLSQIGHFEVAQKAVEFQLKQSPQNPSWLYAQASLYLIQGRKEQAYQAVEKTLKTNPRVIRENLPKDPIWKEELNTPRLQKLLR